MGEVLSQLLSFGRMAFSPNYVLLTGVALTIGVMWLGSIVRGGAPVRAYLQQVLIAPLLGLTWMLFAAILQWAVLDRVLDRSVQGWILVPLLLLVAFCCGYQMAGSGAGTSLKRGTLVTGGAEAQRATRKWLRQNPTGLTLAGIGIGTLDETKHFKLIGTTGTGKSTAIRELLTGALARGDRAVIADPEGGYCRQFFDASRGDVILNPFDTDSRRWDLFREIRAPYDYDQLARSLIGEGEGSSERAWRQYAQVFFSSVLRRAHEEGRTEIGELYRLLTSALPSELRTFLDGTPARPFVEEGNEKLFGSIRSVTTMAVAGLDYIARQAGTSDREFSIRDWVEGSGEGVLFLPYQADQIASLRNLISTWMRIAIFQTMSGPERHPTDPMRLWFVVDELDALGAIDGLKDALARLRKFGGCCVLGFQSIAQVRGTYGDAEAQTIVENCGNTLILRCSASEGGGTARFASKLIGEREIIREHVSHSRSDTILADYHSSVTESVQHVTEAAVLPSEIEQLADLQGFLKVASRPQWMRVRL